MIRFSLADFRCLAQDAFDAGASLRFEARGGSMAPFIRDRDTLLVEPVTAAVLHRGDVVLCQVDRNRVVVHRIVRVRRRHGSLAFLLKGDACSSPDGWQEAWRIMGRVVRLERAGRTVELRCPQWRLAASLIADLSFGNLLRFPPLVRLYRLLRWFCGHRPAIDTLDPEVAQCRSL